MCFAKPRKISSQEWMVWFLINGCIRDSYIINTIDIGIKAINTTPKKSQKKM